jgi:uncharacterized MAPEG superfamily protein
MKVRELKPSQKRLNIEVRLVLSMLYQVKDRLEIKRWMQPQDIFDAHRTLFERIQKACREDYAHEAYPMHCVKAIELLMVGYNQEDIL